MPLVRIDLPATTPPDHRGAINDVVYDALVNVAGAPDNDKFMIISEHGPPALSWTRTMSSRAANAR